MVFKIICAIHLLRTSFKQCRSLSVTMTDVQHKRKHQGDYHIYLCPNIQIYCNVKTAWPIIVTNYSLVSTLWKVLHLSYPRGAQYQYLWWTKVFDNNMYNDHIDMMGWFMTRSLHMMNHIFDNHIMIHKSVILLLIVHVAVQWYQIFHIAIGNETFIIW